MNDGNREKAKATAAALLKDESFVIKYPALARALKESVEPSEEPGGSSSPTAAAVHAEPSPAAEPSLQRSGNGMHATAQQLNGSGFSPLASPEVSSTVLLPGPAAQKPQLPLNPTSSSPAASPPLSGSTSKFPEPTQQASSPVHLAQSHPSRDPQGGEAAETRTGHVTDDALPAAASGIASPTGEPAEKVLHPPVHYMKRLEELQQGYVQIMQHRNSVSLQYELLRKTGRPLTGARLPSAVALSSSPPFMLPSTSARPLVKSVADAWPPGTIEQQQQQQALLQLQRMGATPSAVHPCMPQAVPWIVSAATHSPEAVASAAEAVAGHDGSLAERSAAIHQLRQQLHPHEKPRPTIDPAVLYEKAGIDLAVQHLKDRAERMHAQSREITRALAHKKQQAELEALREKNAHPLLADGGSEAVHLAALLTLPAVQARDGIAVAQAEAARIELRSRDALYHAAYAEDADAELVRLHAERMKDITRIQETNPLPQQCHVTRAVAEGLEDPLEIMAQRNVDFRVQRLSAAAAQLAVSRMLRNLGYSQEREDAVPVRRGEGPAVYKSKCEGLGAGGKSYGGETGEKGGTRREGTGQANLQRGLDERQSCCRKAKAAAQAAVAVSLWMNGCVGSLRPASDSPHKKARSDRHLVMHLRVLILSARCGFLRFPKAYPELGYANALPVSQQGRRELFRKAQQKDGKVRTFADFVEEETQREAVGELDVFSGPGKQLMLAQQEKRKEDDDWARLCLSKLHSKNMALEEAKSARQEAEEAQRSLERMRRRQEELEAERDAMAQLARRREKEAAQAREEAERQAAAASALVRKAPSRSPTLTVEAAARAGDPARRGASAALSRSRTVSLSRASLSQAARIDEKRLLEAENLQNCEKTIQDSFEVLPPKRLHAAIPQQSRRKGEILNNGERKGMLHLASFSFTRSHPCHDSSFEAKGLLPPLNRTQQEEANDEAYMGLMPSVCLCMRLVSRLAAALAERLPPYRCEEFVFLTPPVETTPEKLKLLYTQMKKVFSSGELGSSEHVQMIYDFSVGCCQEFVRKDPASQEYANALVQALPYYPYQIDIQRAGIIALLNIFESSKFQEHLAPPLFEVLTTLMAIDDKELRADVIAVVINTDLVDLLLQQVNESSNSEVVAFCIHILIVARSPHRKTAQYSAFLAVLSKWKHEPAVLTRACLAIDAAAQRAQLEGLASHERKKLLGAGQRLEEGYNDLRRPPSYNEVVQILESKTPKWMPDDASDVDKVLNVMKLNANSRKLQGAACQAIASLARASLEHCQHVAHTAFPVLLSAVSTHPESQSVASGFANSIAIVGGVKACRNCLTQEMMEEVNRCIQRHRCVPEVVSACCAALTILEDFYTPQSEVFGRVTLHAIISALQDSKGSVVLCAHINEFIATFSYHVTTLADARRRAVELGVIEAIVKSMTACSTDPLMCAFGCRAISRLVYKEPDDSKIYTELLKMRAMTTLLFVMFKHGKEPCLAEDALRCIANCASNERCAAAILERGVNVICKVHDASNHSLTRQASLHVWLMADFSVASRVLTRGVVSEHSDNMEVVAQGCRCLWLLSSQPGLQQMTLNRGVLLIEHAAAKYSSSGDSKRLVMEFLLRILKGEGVSRQTVDPLWDAGLDFVRSSDQVPPPSIDRAAGRQHARQPAMGALARQMTAAAHAPPSPRGIGPFHM
ncbi:hypothetical protein cyc_04244 [Cyclospora cayetanensis]|uniref:Uncharacterized protein n=1 Tax=Cyclospora cayetanensis TaxID=88456 RepID=A0A1D3D849_9EIME|nr:hypothetical protein cyc_04244 [Cyclospora cayetanensis]